MKAPFFSPAKKRFLAIASASFLAAYSASAVMVTWVGTNEISATTNWSDANNWDQINTFTHVSPANNAANFTFWTAMPTAGRVTINVDGAYGTPGAGLAQSYGAYFGQTNGYHTVFIQPGITWSVQASTPGPGVGVMVSPGITNNNTIGSGTVNPGIAYTNYTTIGGLGGTFSINGSGLRVEAGSTIVTNHYSILDMSGLGTFIMTNTTPGSGNGASDYFYLVNGSANSQGLIYLAQTNLIYLYDAFQVGYLGTSSNSLPIGVYLGQSNYIATGAGNNNMIIGYTGCTNGFMKFNPALLGGPTMPTAYFTGNGGSQNVMICNGNNGKVPVNAICDLRGGNITWSANTMTVGVSGTAGVSANGVLTFDNGTITANTVVLGSQPNSAGAPGMGTLDIGTNAIFQVNNYIVLGTNVGTVTAGTSGTINITTNGTLLANTVTNGGGAGTVNMTNANWDVALNSTSGTNMIVTAFSANGTTNLINITAITPLLNGTVPLRFHLIAASTITGGSSLGVTVPVSYDPAHPYAGYIDATTTPGLVDFVLTSAPPSARQLVWAGTNSLGSPVGDWDVNTTADWLFNGALTTYTQFDLATFNDIPPTAQSSISLGAIITPYSMTVNNAATLYTIGGLGNLSGSMSLAKQGTNTLILDNSTSNSFTGGVTISGGILQVGTNDTAGNLPAGKVVDNSALVYDRTDNVAFGGAISGSGIVVSAGGGTLQLLGANTFGGSAVATNNSTLQGGVAGAFGASSGTVFIASGSTLDPDGAGTTRAIVVSGAGVGGNGAIVNSGALIGDSAGGLTPSLTLTGDTTLSYPTRWDLGSSTGATLSTQSNAYNLTLNGNGNYFEWRDVRSDTNLANINVVSGDLGIAGNTSVGNPTNTLNIATSAGLKFYNDDGFNAAINKQVILNDLGLIQNGAGNNTMYGGLDITNSAGNQYCYFTINGSTSLTINSTVTGNGILWMQGSAGTLVLNGNGSTFTGGVLVPAGTFTLNGAIGCGITSQSSSVLTGSGTATGLVDVQSGATFYPGGAGTTGTFTAAGGLNLEGGSALTMDLRSTTDVGGGTNDLIAVSGDLNAGGITILINPIAGTLANGTYVLMTYTGNLIGSFASAQMVASSRYTLTLNVSTHGQIQLVVSGNPNNLVWNNAANDSQWNVQGSYDWTNLTTHLEDQFYSSDSVTFDDTTSTLANPGTNITISQTVSPGSITVNSVTNNYTFNGNSIGGGATLLKQGASLLVVNTANSFAGSVTIAGGTVRAGNASALGAATGMVTITNGATLDFAGNYIPSKSYYVAGGGVGGNGAIVNSGAAIFDSTGSVTNITLLSDATFGGNGRWDFGNRSTTSTLSTGGHPYNLTLTNASVNTYTWEWYNVIADPALNNINVEAGELGLAGSNYLGNPNGFVNIYPAAELVVYGGSNYAKNYYLTTNGEIQINAGGPLFNFALTMDGGSIFSTAVAVQVTGPVSLTGGLAKFNLVAIGSFSNTISGVGGIEMIDADTSPLILAGTNTYSGSTVLMGGGSTLELLASGSIAGSTNINLETGSFLIASTRTDGTLALGNGQTLDGTGTINGSLVANAGSTVIPGANGLGTLTVTNNISLGGTTSMGLGATSNNLLSGLSVGYGGTLSLSFAPGSLSAGNSFKLFNATSANYAGSFASITPTTPGTGLQWDTSQLDVSGTLKVAPASSAASFIGPFTVSGSNLILNGTGGTPDGTFHVYTSTNIAAPLGSWMQVTNGSFDGSGNFSVTNVINTNVTPQFFILKTP